MTDLQISRALQTISQFCIDLRMTKKQAISAQILLLQSKGATHQQAFDAVLGQGTFKRVADELYDELRAKAAA